METPHRQPVCLSVAMHLKQVLPGPHQVPQARVLQRIANQAAGNNVRRLWPQPWGLQLFGGNLLALRRGLRGSHGQPPALGQQIGASA